LIHTKLPILCGWGVKLTTHLHLVPKLRMSGGIPVLPLHAFIALTGKKFTIYLFIIIMFRKD